MKNKKLFLIVAAVVVAGGVTFASLFYSGVLFRGVLPQIQSFYSASCTPSNPTPKAGESVAFTGTVIGGITPYKYKWSGEGVEGLTTQDAHAKYTTDQAGTHEITFTVTDNTQTQKLVGGQLIISPDPKAASGKCSVTVAAPIKSEPLVSCGIASDAQILLDETDVIGKNDVDFVCNYLFNDVIAHVTVLKGDDFVRSLEKLPHKQGTVDYSWGGLDANNNLVEPGDYTFNILATKSGYANYETSLKVKALSTDDLVSCNVDPLILDLFAKTKGGVEMNCDFKKMGGYGDVAVLKGAIYNPKNIISANVVRKFNPFTPASTSYDFTWNGTDDSSAFVTVGDYTMVASASKEGYVSDYVFLPIRVVDTTSVAGGVDTTATANTTTTTTTDETPSGEISGGTTSGGTTSGGTTSGGTTSGGTTSGGTTSGGGVTGTTGATGGTTVTRVSTATNCAGYRDVLANDPACDAIEYVQSIGAMTGNPDGTFAPSDLLQRDQIAKIVLEAFDLYNKQVDYCQGLNPFPDVMEVDWAWQYICRARTVGAVTGYQSGADKGTYRPERNVNKAEFLALLLRNVKEKMPSVSSKSYNDVSTGQWYSGYARYSYDNKLFAGSSLHLTDYVTRKEVAWVMYRLHQLGKL